MTVPTGTGTGTLVVTVKNSISDPIQDIKVISTNGLSLDGAASTASWDMASVVTFPTPIGSSASGATSVCDIDACAADATGTLTAGASYVFTVTVYFADGGTGVQTLSLNAAI